MNNSGGTAVSPSSILVLCDGSIQALQTWPLPTLEESELAESLSHDVKSFRTAHDLVDQKWRSQPPRAKFEEDHWDIVRRLTERCRTILNQLYDILEGQRSTVLNASLSNQKAGTRQRLNEAACDTFRSHFALHTKALQLTTHVCDL